MYRAPGGGGRKSTRPALSKTTRRPLGGAPLPNHDRVAPIFGDERFKADASERARCTPSSASLLRSALPTPIGAGLGNLDFLVFRAERSRVSGSIAAVCTSRNAS